MRLLKFIIRELSPLLVLQLNLWAKTGHYVSSRSFSFYSFEWEYRDERVIMARKSKGGTQVLVDKVSPGKIPLSWANIKLGDDDLQIVLQWSETPDEIGARLARYFIAGYGFSVKFQPERPSYSAFITGLEGGVDGGECGISAYAPDAITAVAAVLVKTEIFLTEPERASFGKSSMGIG